MNPANKIIVTLDTGKIEEIKNMVESLLDFGVSFKIGQEVINSLGGPQTARVIHSLGGTLFYDVKLSDTPNTVKKASKAISSLGVGMFSVHASSGFEAMKEAAQNKGNCVAVAVTILTSLDCKDIWDMGYINSWPSITSFEAYDNRQYIDFVVSKMAKQAKKAGLDGVVCSAKNLIHMSMDKEFFNSIIKVTPGIRPFWYEEKDQKNCVTPFEAVRLGADYLVIGRPITDPPKKIGSPKEALKRIIDEIALC